MIIINIFVLLLLSRTAVAAPVDITADAISRSPDGVVTARGNVVIKRETDTLMADEVKYRTRQHLLEASGHVVIRSDKATIAADEAVMHTNSKTGNMKQAVITLPGGERLTAARVRRIDDQTFEAEELIFSSCPINEESWRIAASRATLDNEDGSLTATNSRFELWEIPVLYTPWWQQPIRRKSGLLLPELGVGKRRGTEVGIPVYFAPAENWDATLTPHWMSARGLMGEGELRHISSFGHERINIEGINDTMTGINRGRLQGELLWRLPGNMRLDASANHVTDHDYLADFSTGDEISSVYLHSSAALSQSIQSGSFEADWFVQTQHQQNLRLTSNATTLQILPRIQSRMQWAPLQHLILHLDQQSTRFDRRTAVDGWRVHLNPWVEIPWELAGGGISATLTAGSQHTRYWLKQSNLADTTPNRTTAEASLEVRSDFEYVGRYKNWRHTISPLVRYDYINAPNQSALPNFDSGFGLLTWNNLLSGNRFSGLDRIENTHRVSLLMETRLQFKNDLAAAARDALIVRGGVSYDLLRNSVDNTLQPAASRPFSNLLGEIIWQPIASLKLSAHGQYNTADRYWATIQSSANLTISKNNWLRAGYRFTDSRYSRAVQLFNISGNASLGSRWLASGSWQYDLLLKLSQQVVLGLKYRHPCWSLGFEGYRINRRSGTNTASNYGFRLLLEFKGLGSVGS